MHRNQSKRKPQIGVIGSAHMDILAFYARENSNELDKPGNVSIGIGGTAFNIAANLVQDYPVDLITALPTHSLARNTIESVAWENGINLTILESETESDPAFVGQFRDNDMASAVTHTAVDDDRVSQYLTQEDLSTYQLIVLDCNLPASVIADVARNKTLETQNILISAVSQAKSNRIIEAANRVDSDNLFDVASMNEAEFRYQINDNLHPDDADTKTCKLICQLFAAQSVVITRDSRGHKVLNNSGCIYDMPAPSIDSVVSTLGAGDALLSGIIDVIAVNGTLFGHEKDLKTHRFIHDILACKGANPIA